MTQRKTKKINASRGSLKTRGEKINYQITPQAHAEIYRFPINFVSSAGTFGKTEKW